MQAAAGRWAGGPISQYGLCRGDGHASAGPEQDRKLLPCGPVAKEYRMNLESQGTQKWLPPGNDVFVFCHVKKVERIR